MNPKILILFFGAVELSSAFRPAGPRGPLIDAVPPKQRANRRGSMGSNPCVLYYPRFCGEVGVSSRQFMSKNGSTQTDKPLATPFESDGSDDAEGLDEEILAEIEAGQPSEWMVMKELLGINIFTYLLAAAIVFFLSMNIVVGPGWLGNSLGIAPNWDVTKTSDAIPAAVDLSRPDFLIHN